MSLLLWLGLWCSSSFCWPHLLNTGDLCFLDAVARSSRDDTWSQQVIVWLGLRRAKCTWLWATTWSTRQWNRCPRTHLACDASTCIRTSSSRRKQTATMSLCWPWNDPFTLCHIFVSISREGFEESREILIICFLSFSQLRFVYQKRTRISWASSVGQPAGVLWTLARGYDRRPCKLSMFQ